MVVAPYDPSPAHATRRDWERPYEAFPYVHNAWRVRDSLKQSNVDWNSFHVIYPLSIVHPRTILCYGVARSWFRPCTPLIAKTKHHSCHGSNQSTHKHCQGQNQCFLSISRRACIQEDMINPKCTCAPNMDCESKKEQDLGSDMIPLRERRHGSHESWETLVVAGLK